MTKPTTIRVETSSSFRILASATFIRAVQLLPAYLLKTKQQEDVDIIATSCSKRGISDGFLDERVPSSHSKSANIDTLRINGLFASACTAKAGNPVEVPLSVAYSDLFIC